MGRRYWFPLVLLGFGLLVLASWETLGTSTYVCCNTGSHAFLAPEAVVVAFPGTAVSRFPMREPVWELMVIVVLVSTTVWYGRHARRAGESIRGHVVAGLVGLGVVLLCHLAADIADSVSDSGVVTSVGLPLLALGVVAGAWANARPGPARRPAVALSVGSLAFGLGIVLGVVAPGLVDPVLVAGGLLALARLERSRPLAAVACVALLTMVVFPTGTRSLLIPAMLFLVAGFAALATRRPPAVG